MFVLIGIIIVVVVIYLGRVIAYSDDDEVEKTIREEKTEKEKLQRSIDLFEALKNKDTQTARTLIENGVNVNYTDEICQTEKSILQLSIENEDREIVSLLLDKGANVNLIIDAKTPLDYAKNEEVISLLKSHGAKTKAEMDEEYRKKMEEDQRKLMASKDLLVAVAKQDIARVLAYIELGADVNYSDLTGSSPLVFAVLRENMEIIQILLKNGANPMQENDVIGGGKTCAVWTARYNLKNERLATFLEDYYCYHS